MGIFQTIWTALTTENALLTNIIILPINFIESIIRFALMFPGVGINPASFFSISIMKIHMITLRILLYIEVLLLSETNFSSNADEHMNPAVIPYVLKKSS